MHNKYILTVVCLFMVCVFAGCAESNDLATQNVASSVASESSQPESSPFEETVSSGTDSQTETKNESKATDHEAVIITSDSAENIALNNLGITRDDVKYIHSYEEHDGGSIVAWCVEFEVNNTQYNYYVDMITGEILKVFEETHN